MAMTTVRIARWWWVAGLGVLTSAVFLVTAVWAAPPVLGHPTGESPVHRPELLLADPPTLTLTPEPATVGAPILVTGTGHCPLYWQSHDGYFAVALGFGDSLIVRAQGIRGGFSATINAPDSPGRYVLTSTCLDDPVAGPCLLCGAADRAEGTGL